jgi:hypothetical protein
MSGPVRIVRMGGSSIAAPGAAAWITDFLNAAYYARPADRRDVADLRLALCILVTAWARRGGRRLGVRDLPAFHRAFGTARLGAGGRLERERLLDGAAGMIGDWFPDAHADPGRRAHGVAFETVEERRAYDPALRLARAALAPLDPPRAPPAQRHWSTYPPVPVPDVAAAVRFLCDPARWPDMGSAAGWFTAVRAGGLPGVTFEIDVSAALVPRAPMFTRAYVTATDVQLEGDGLERAARELGEHVDEALPAGARPAGFVQLTSHRGHFLGRAHSHLLLYEHDGAGFIRDVGCWDPLPAHLSAAYAAAGREAQQAFWGPEPADLSMLAQLARVSTQPWTAAEDG